MAFENLSSKLQEIFKQLRSKGKLTEKDVQAAMREVRLALLEADVNFKIVKSFIAAVTEKAVGYDVLEGLNPAQQVIKIVNDELIALLGGAQSKLTFSPKPPTVIMSAGLQGAGKTTFCGKLGVSLRRQGRKPLLAACDVYRPAAVKQLQIVGNNFQIPVFAREDSDNPVSIAKSAVDYALANGFDTVVIDTAGRLHINEELMRELRDIKATVRPQEILLVVDAMTGQDAVNVAEAFDAQLGIDGVVVTKLDGDTRGGAALSVRAVTGKPIKYIGVGEKTEDLEPFYPDRMASRILGMGDVLSLIEKAQQNFDDNQARELEKKMLRNDFSLQDFLTQMRQVKKLGPLKNMLGMIPGMQNLKLDEDQLDEKQLDYVEAMILSMTPFERENPSVLNSSRKRRVARGSGRSIQEVNRLLKQFEEMKRLMQQFSGISKGRRGKLNLPFFKN